MTKPMTATAIMMLVEQGRLGLGRAVQDYIPEFQGKGKEDVLVWHLLTHTSGLRQEDVEFYAARPEWGCRVPPPEPTRGSPAQARSSIDATACRYGRRRATQMAYTTYNYTLLGEIVSRVSGLHLSRIRSTGWIFAPLGMTAPRRTIRGRTRPVSRILPLDAPVRVMLSQSPSPARGMPGQREAVVYVHGGGPGASSARRSSTAAATARTACSARRRSPR